MQTVSVIVAVLNRASTLQRCIDSVADQTHHALELILFDGGSKDGSREILEANTAKITHWQSGPDRGIPQAWNMALERATGEWICFLGADDRFATSSAIRTLTTFRDRLRLSVKTDELAGSSGHDGIGSA